MQQTVDAVVNVTKDQDAVVVLDSDLETTLVSGSSYFLSSVAATAGVETVADVVADATIAVSGSSYFLSSVADSVLAEAEMVADAVADATICAANLH